MAPLRSLAIPIVATTMFALAGCAGSDGAGVDGPVTVYASLPMTGPRSDAGRDAADGARLALEQAGGRAGGLEVRAEFRDDAGGKAWDPVAVGENAREAAQDSSTAAYIGELDSEPTRASVPITNEAAIAQISPGAGGVDLTRPAEGYPDSPDRYRPSGEASFARVIPDDATIATGAADWAAELGLRRVVVELDDSPWGRLTAEEFEARAAEVGVQALDRGTGDARDTTLSAGAFDGLGFSAPASGLVTAALAPTNLPAREFAGQFRSRIGREPGPYAAYGYEAMALALQAIEQAEGEEEFRTGVRDAVFEAERPDSILGNYSITPDGDTTLCAIQRYEIRGGELVPLEAPCVRG